MPIELPERHRGSDRRRGFALPDSAGVPRQSIGRDPGVRVPDFGAGLTALAGSMENVGDELFRAARRQQKEYDTTQTDEAELAFGQTAMTEWQRRQEEDDPSRPQFMGDYGQWLAGEVDPENGIRGAGGLVAQILQSLPKDVSPEARERLRLRLLQSAQGMEEAAGRLSLSESARRKDAALTERVNQWSAQAARDPDFLATVLADADERLADEDPVKAVAARSTVIKSALIGMARSGRMRDAETKLDSGEYDGELSVTDKASVRSVIDAERKERLRLAEKAEREAKERMALEADEALKGFYSLEAPTMQDAENLRRMPGVTPAEYKAARESITNTGADRDDPAVVAEIMPRLDSEDLTRELTDALRQNRIKTETFRTLINQNRAALKDDRPASPYKSGRNFLSIALDPGQLGGDGTIRQPLAIARASALADYDTFVEANPDINRQQAFDKARELMEQYQNVAFGQMTLALPRPRGYLGSKRDVTIETVNAARQNLKTLITTGQMSGNEAAREIQALDIWESVLTRQTQAK